jgi:hypothetical protein
MSIISPLPQCTKERKRKRALQKYQILSSSPCKRNLEEEERENLKEKTKKTELLKRHKKSVGGRLKIDSEKPSSVRYLELEE